MTEGLKTLLAQYDVSGKNINFARLMWAVEDLKQAGDDSTETMAEFTALVFAINYPNKENGGCSPDTTCITGDFIDHWTRRAGEAVNPLLKMVYSGLVWEFGKRVTGREPDYKTIKLVHVNACIEAVEGDYAEYYFQGMEYGRRAIDKAIGLSDQSLIDKAIAALFAYSERIAEDKDGGIWGDMFNILLSHIKQFANHEQAIVASMCRRFGRLEEKVLQYGLEFYGALEYVAELFAKYYTQKGEASKAGDYLDRVLVALRGMYKELGGMRAQMMLMRLQGSYRMCGLDKQANALFPDIKQLGPSALREMSTMSIPLHIKHIDLDAIVEARMSESAEKTLGNYITEFLSILSKERAHQERVDRTCLFLAMSPLIVYDNAGVPIYNVSAGEEASEDRLIHGMGERMHLCTLFIQLFINKMKERGFYTYDNVLAMFNNSPLIDADKRPLFERGLKAYFEEDYVVACSLLVPQFENAVRNLVDLLHFGVLRSSKDPKDGMEYKSLDTLLALLEKEVPCPYMDSIVCYFKCLFTHKFGWNLRNLISHGLMSADQMNRNVADRIVHAFLLLSRMELRPKNDIATKTS